MKGNLIQTSFEVLDEECIQAEIRSAKDVVYEIMDIGKRLSYRWEKIQEYNRWEANGSVGDEPKFMDKDTREIRSSRYALSPCKLVNTELESLVDIALRWYSCEKINNVMNMVTTDVTIARSVGQIRQICIHSEEAMEQEAMELIFKMVEMNPITYKDMVIDIAKRSYRDHSLDDDQCSLKQLTLIDEVTYRFLKHMKSLITIQSGTSKEFLCREQQERVSLLHTLVVDVPKYMQKIHPFVYKGMVFKYFGNYLSLVIGELQLLTTPLMLHNKSEKEGKCLVALACEVPDLISSSQSDTKICGYGNCKNGCKEPIHLISAADLSSKTFTFVGAGFPLTGVLLHVLTGGAKINLVDCDANVVKNAKTFVEITECLGITDVGAISIVHAYGEDVIYQPTTTRVTSVKQNTAKAVRQIPEQTINTHMSTPSPENVETDLTNDAETVSNLSAASTTIIKGNNATSPSTECDVLSRGPKENCVNENRRMIVVPTDILDIASAIPQDVTRKILRDNAMEVAVVRKRNTRGMSEIMYEKFTLESEPCRFQLVMEVAPPQKVVSGASPEYLLAGLLSTKNLNSCQLYLNSELIRNVRNDMDFYGR